MNAKLDTFFQKTLPVGRLMCNCQILVSPETHEAVLVDPGDEGARIVSELKNIEAMLGITLKVEALLHTHAHFDHIGGTRKVKEHFLNAGLAGASDAPEIYLHRADEFMYNMLPKQAAMFGMQNDEPLPIDQFLVDNQTLQFGKMKFTVLHTPGHSPGGLCFRLHEDSALNIPETVFTGDTLFKESVGRVDLWGGDEQTLVKSIHNRLLNLDGDTIAWPGHGFKTTIGHEKLKNPYLT